MSNKEQKYRHEYKYICSLSQRIILKLRVQGLLHVDPHASDKGYYRIRSLYFDTPDDMCYYDNENGVENRCKYRIRIYNGSKERIVLEKKVKQDQMGYKLSCRLTEEECRTLMQGRYPVEEEATIQSELPEEKGSVKKRMLREMKLQLMTPKVIVEYVRYPFVESGTNVRVTFDENICSSNELDKFLDDNISLRPVNQTGQGILEIKWDGILPDFIRKNLQLHSLTRSGYSKYYYCRKFNLYGGTRV